jgi:hypothetical protein
MVAKRRRVRITAPTWRTGRKDRGQQRCKIALEDGIRKNKRRSNKDWGFKFSQKILSTKERTDAKHMIFREISHVSLNKKGKFSDISFCRTEEQAKFRYVSFSRNREVQHFVAYNLAIFFSKYNKTRNRRMLWQIMAS